MATASPKLDKRKALGRQNIKLHTAYEGFNTTKQQQVLISYIHEPRPKTSNRSTCNRNQYHQNNNKSDVRNATS
jgi:hypothetical protein